MTDESASPSSDARQPEDVTKPVTAPALPAAPSGKRPTDTTPRGSEGEEVTAATPPGSRGEAATTATPLVDDEAPIATTPPRPPSRPGLGVFTIEGRAAPGLFVVGWLATILGAGLLFVGFAGARGLSSTLLVLGGFAVLSGGLLAAGGSQALDRRANGSPYAGPSPYLLFAASVAVSSLIASFVALGARLLSVDPASQVVTIIVLAVIQASYLMVTRLLVIGTGALTWAEMGFRRPDRERLRELVSGITAAIPTIAITVLIAGLATRLLPVQPDSPLPATGTFGGLLLNLLGGAVLVPIGEETMFRGVATTAWARRYGTSRAIVQGALFFAFVHVLQVGGSSVTDALALAVVAFATRVPVGLALGWLFLSRRSIWASIGLHAGFNGVLLILAELAVRASTGGA